MTQVMLLDGVKLFVLVAGVFYAALVVAGYATEGPHYQARFHFAEPARSGERLLLWTGIKILEAAISLLRLVFNQLFIASGELALWAINKSSPRVQREVHSRFL
ncbi:MAG: hypothetical protein ACRD22_06540 [Terriglobia bacterium]